MSAGGAWLRQRAKYRAWVSFREFRFISTHSPDNAILFGSSLCRTWCPEVASTHTNTQRRRSERISHHVPLIVRGVDLLGQPFEERTSTLAFNLHGCRYASRHHLPKNTWVTLELPQTRERRNVRARVAWVQRPRSVREMFQIAVELESPLNIWELETVPADWTRGAAHSAGAPDAIPAAGPSEPRESELREPAASLEHGSVPPALANFLGRLMSDISNASVSPDAAESPLAFDFSPAGDSPLLRELRAGLERHARQAVEGAAADAQEQMRRAAEEDSRKQAAAIAEALGRFRGEFEQQHGEARDEFNRAAHTARAEFSAHLAAYRDELAAGLKTEFEQNLVRAQEAAREAVREAAAELERSAQALRAESETALDAARSLAQARLEMEAADAARASKPAEEPKEEAPATDEAMAAWRASLESEMNVARGQWDELLQSSLDAGARRLAEQLTERSQEILRASEARMKDQAAAVHEPFAGVSESAREGAAAIKSQLEQEVSRAWASLAEIEHAAGRLKEYSAQLEAASQDTINDLHRRLAAVLDSQTAELNHRAEALAAALSQRARPALDSLGREFIDRTVAEVEAKLRPHVERVPDLVRELSARESQADESLRLHRERLRQVSEQHVRDVASQIAATQAELRGGFEAARREALVKWSEELDAAGVRASHAAAENIGRTSEWFEQEARAHLQVLVEQTLANAANAFEQKTSEAGKKLEAQLAGQTSAQLSEIARQVDGVAGEVTGRTRSQIEEAAAAAAASFGQVLRGISEEETRQFTDTSRAVAMKRSQEFESAAQDLLRNLEMAAGRSVERFQAQLAGHVETRVVEARETLNAECGAVLNGYRSEREELQREWLVRLDQMSAESARVHGERLQSAGDHWVVSSVRRLNEHGQDTVESLMRSADQAIRDSFAKIFAGLSESLRGRQTDATGVAGFAPPPSSQELTEAAPGPRADAASNTPKA
jgi:hypothetical protein